MKRPGPRLWILTAITGAAVYGAWTAWQGQLGTSLAYEIAAAKQEGVPVDPSDLIEPEIPEAENAARPYLTAVSHARSVMDGSMWSKKFSDARPRKRRMDSLSPAERGRLRALIAPLQPAITALERTSRRSRLVLHRRYSIDANYSDVSTCKHLVRAIAVRAELNSLNGDWRAGLADLEMSARVSALFATSLTSYEAFMRGQIEKEILESVGRIVARHSTEPDLPAQIRKVVKALGPPPEPRRVMADYAWSGRQSVAYFAAGGDSCTPGEPLLQLRSIREANEAQFVSHARQIFRSFPQDPYDFERLRRGLQTADARSGTGGRLRTLVPVGESAYIAGMLAMNEARRRVALGGADVLDEWRRYGRLPKALGDPFGGRLHCRVVGNACAVYSVGGDRKDNGGAEREEEDSDDIVWRFPLPKRDPATIRVAKR